MNYDFSNMKGKARKLYTKMWGGTEFTSDDFITNKNCVIKATLNAYVPTQNVAELYKQYVEKPKKKI